METDAAVAAGGLARLAIAWAAVIAWVVVADDAEELEELHNDPFKTRVAGLNYKYSRA